MCWWPTRPRRCARPNATWPTFRAAPPPGPAPINACCASFSLCDTPGFMVGPEAERTALVRHVSRMFVTAGNISVPFLSVIVRKGYGLGAQAMTGGSFHAPLFTVAWPSGEFGPMGLEGAVRLGYRKELAAISDPQERQAQYISLKDLP